MKRHIIRNVVIATTICAGLFIAPTGAEGQQRRLRIATDAAPGKDAGAERVKALEKLLGDYASENAALKLRVKELEAQLEQLKQNRGVTIVPGPLKLPPDKVPPDWKPFQFNGVTYYIIPCERTAAAGMGGTTGSFSVRPGVDWQRLLTDGQTQTGSGSLRRHPPQRDVDERPAK